MASATPSEITQILHQLQEDGVERRSANDRIFELTYAELQRIASNAMRRERAEHTLQPTALVHEAYCRLVDQTGIEWKDRAHFFGIAARAMRQILVDHARRRAAAKRGGDWQRVTLDDQLGLAGQPSQIEVILLDQALGRLGEMDERTARVAELRIFGGMNSREIAHVLGISRRTVDGEWRVGKMWLSHQMLQDDAS